MTDMEIVYFDVKTAFLYNYIDKELYMKQLKGHDGSGHVCQLKKGLYGLKQSPRIWNKRLNNVLTKFGLDRTLADLCIYMVNSGDVVTMLALYVDNGLLYSTSKAIGNILDTLILLNKDR